MRAVVAGFGNVARALARTDASWWDELPEITITGLITGTDGPRHVTPPAPLRDFDVHEASYEPASSESDLFADADVLIEVSPLRPADGEPALARIRAALDAGLHVVTSNKGPIAWALDDLEARASERGVLIQFSACVIGSVPLIPLLRGPWSHWRINWIEAVLNSTSSYVLEQRQSGVALEQALETARRRGWVETDPAMDLEGLDPAMKIVILARLALGKAFTPADVTTVGVSTVTSAHITRANATGARIRLLSTADPGGLKVVPQALSQQHPLWGCTASGLGAVFDRDGLGQVVIRVDRPGVSDTAWAIAEDLRAIASKP